MKSGLGMSVYPEISIKAGRYLHMYFDTHAKDNRPSATSIQGNSLI